MIRIIGTVQRDKDVLLYYSYPKGPHNFFKVVSSHDGYQFNGSQKYIIVADEKGREEKAYDFTNFRITKLKDQYYMTYKVNGKKGSNLNGAVSNELLRWKKTGKIDQITETGTLVPDFKFHNRYVMYFGEKSIKVAYSSDLKSWKPEGDVLLAPRNDHFDNEELEVGNAFEVDGHILLIYYAKHKIDGKHRFAAGAAIIDMKDPHKVIWRSDKPLWEHPEKFHHERLSPLGSIIVQDQLILYWHVGESNVFAVSCPIPGRHIGLKDKVFNAILKKYENNPIISPDPNHPWESRATFNSAALFEDGKVHFLYRALGDTDLSVIGYATSRDGIHIDERSEEPIYVPTEPFETPGGRAMKTWAEHFASGGGYGGIEDPRVTKVGDTIYMTYVAFDGATPPRAAMTSINVNDFLKKNWDKWASPRLISAPGMVNKSAVIMPEKVNGKYVVFHRVYPNILVDYLDDLEFNDYLQGHYFIPPRKKFWDSKKIGAGAPPMRTKDGWLMIYQSVGYQDPGRYKIGAMMLDINDPRKVLYRSSVPLIEPVEHYENNGFKAGVVYPCGAVIMNDKLHVYYGGSDSFVCAASADLEPFLADLKRNKEPKLHKVESTVLNLN